MVAVPINPLISYLLLFAFTILKNEKPLETEYLDVAGKNLGCGIS